MNMFLQTISNVTRTMSLAIAAAINKGGGTMTDGMQDYQLGDHPGVVAKTSVINTT